MKKTLSLLIAAALLIPSTAAFAEGTTRAANPQKEARQEFKAKLQPQRDALKHQRERNQALREQIKSKKQEIKSIVKSLRENKDAASKAKLQEIKARLTGLKDSREALKDMKGAGKPYWEQLKANIKAMNLDAALSNIESISNLRDSRYELLQKIDTTLTEILGLLKA